MTILIGMQPWCGYDVIKYCKIPKYLNYFIVNIKWADLHEFKIGM